MAVVTCARHRPRDPANRAQMSASVRDGKELHTARRSKMLIVRWPRVGRCAAGDDWLKIAPFHERLAYNTIALVFSSRTRLERKRKKKGNLPAMVANVRAG